MEKFVVFASRGVFVGDASGACSCVFRWVFGIAFGSSSVLMCGCELLGVVV